MISLSPNTAPGSLTLNSQYAITTGPTPDLDPGLRAGDPQDPLDFYLQEMQNTIDELTNTKYEAVDAEEFKDTFETHRELYCSNLRGPNLSSGAPSQLEFWQTTDKQPGTQRGVSGVDPNWTETGENWGGETSHDQLGVFDVLNPPASRSTATSQRHHLITDGRSIEGTQNTIQEEVGISSQNGSQQEQSNTGVFDLSPYVEPTLPTKAVHDADGYDSQDNLEPSEAHTDCLQVQGYEQWIASAEARLESDPWDTDGSDQERGSETQSLTLGVYRSFMPPFGFDPHLSDTYTRNINGLNGYSLHPLEEADESLCSDDAGDDVTLDNGQANCGVDRRPQDFR